MVRQLQGSLWTPHLGICTWSKFPSLHLDKPGALLTVITTSTMVRNAFSVVSGFLRCWASLLPLGLFKLQWSFGRGTRRVHIVAVVTSPYAYPRAMGCGYR